MAPATAKTNYRKALLSTQEERDAEQARIAKERDEEEARIVKELEAKNIFNKLPREIRDMIWRLLLLRPATILPGSVKFHRTSSRKAGDHFFWYDQHEHRRYGYLWDERRQTEERDYDAYGGWMKFVPAYPGGYHNRYPEELTIMIPTEPTSTQAEYIAQGLETLPFTLNKEFGSQVGCETVHRGEAGDKFTQVINRVEVSVDGLNGLAMMRVSKQALAECREVLYGENTFSFKHGEHERNELDHYPHWIPGMPKKNGAPQTSHQLNNAFDRMFTPGAFLPKFVARDPMLQFFHRIGRINASLLTKIKIEGRMKTVYRYDLDYESSSEHASLGFSRILDIFTVVLKHACPNLRELTLHMKDKSYYEYKERMAWDDDPYDKAGKSDEQRIDTVVENVVIRLESLKVLWLGGYQSFPSPSRMNDEKSSDEQSADEEVSKPVFDDEWGNSAR